MDFRKRFFQPHTADGKIGVSYGVTGKNHEIFMGKNWINRRSTIPRARGYRGWRTWSRPWLLAPMDPMAMKPINLYNHIIQQSAVNWRIYDRSPDWAMTLMAFPISPFGGLVLWGWCKNIIDGFSSLQNPGWFGSESPHWKWPSWGTPLPRSSGRLNSFGSFSSCNSDSLRVSRILKDGGFAQTS